MSTSTSLNRRPWSENPRLPDRLAESLQCFPIRPTLLTYPFPNKTSQLLPHYFLTFNLLTAYIHPLVLVHPYHIYYYTLNNHYNTLSQSESLLSQSLPFHSKPLYAIPISAHGFASDGSQFTGVDNCSRSPLRPNERTYALRRRPRFPHGRTTKARVTKATGPSLTDGRLDSDRRSSSGLTQATSDRKGSKTRSPSLWDPANELLHRRRAREKPTVGAKGYLNWSGLPTPLNMSLYPALLISQTNFHPIKQFPVLYFSLATGNTTQIAKVPVLSRPLHLISLSSPPRPSFLSLRCRTRS